MNTWIKSIKTDWFAFNKDMPNVVNNFRCPCCNEPLDEYEISMYDMFEGMREDCFNESMRALQDQLDQELIKDIDLDLGEC